MSTVEPTDQEIEQTIRDRCAADPQLNLANLRIHVSNRTVRVAGVVPSDEERRQVVDVIRAVPGVAAVTDELLVPPAERRA